MRNKTLLLGNGVNLISENISWEELMDNIIKEIKKSDVIKKDNKPFPLLYEEIHYRAVKYKNINEYKLKQIIAKQIKKMRPNKYHVKILNLNFNNILTTNYDYNLERCINPNNGLCDNLLNESKYNLFRRRNVLNKYIWHIHGEANAPNCITLGYDHYSGYLQKMRNYLTGQLRTKKYGRVDSPVILKKFNFEDNNDGLFSWVDIFLKDDIYILGLSLDYVEIDLWWLITYKERLKITDDLPLGTTHYYFYYEDKLKDIDNAKIDLLESLGIEVHTEKIIEKKYSEKYDKFIEHFNN